MNVSRPVWLLDVDGPINLQRRDFNRAWTVLPVRREVHAFDLDGQTIPFKLIWCPELVARIRRIIHGGTIDVRWCTSWCDQADVLERLWCLPALPRELTGEQCRLPTGHRDRAKTERALALAEGGHRVIWTDDDAVPHFGPVLDRLTRSGALTIRPNPKVGLRPEDLDRIEAFAAAPAGVVTSGGAR